MQNLSSADEDVYPQVIFQMFLFCFVSCGPFVIMRTSQKMPNRGRVTRLDIDKVRTREHYRGRGAITNQTGRYEAETNEAFDDGWNTIEDAAPPLRTTLTAESAKTIITFNQSPDIHVDRSINPYRGCEHGCIYCFARPSHAYLGLSAGLDFESKLFFKPNAPELLRAALAKPNYKPRQIALGINTDAYQPVERETRLTREIVSILADHNHPVSFLTKSTLIQRDIDLIAPMAAKGLARVGISISTLDRALARKIEPRAATPQKRLDTVKTLNAAGIPTIVMHAPIIPALNDHEIETVLDAAKTAGAVGAGYVVLRLPYELKDIFHEWLATHYPDRAVRIVNHLREMRGGKDYDGQWFRRGRGEGPYAKLIGQRFKKTLKRLGFSGNRITLRTDLFRVPPKSGDQMDFGL